MSPNAPVRSSVGRPTSTKATAFTSRGQSEPASLTVSSKRDWKSDCRNPSTNIGLNTDGTYASALAMICLACWRRVSVGFRNRSTSR